jgi:indoleamine 2,3-dioxygenase
MHLYIHTLPPDAPIRIPAPITIPLLQISAQLQLPPVLTYSDDVLYNWAPKVSEPDALPSPDNLRCQTLFTGTTDEEEFYLCSARIELRGVEALELMRATMDETFVGDDIAVRRIAKYLTKMSLVIEDFTRILLAVRSGCDPEFFYSDIRPWFRGADADPAGRKWEFEGLDHVPELREPTELSGASAGQSSLIHALDIFLGVNQFSHSPGDAHNSPSSRPHPPPLSSLSTPTSESMSAPSSSSVPHQQQTSEPSFLIRMQSYMPRHHRHFLRHLSANPRPLRAFVLAWNDADLLGAYNDAVRALKGFRDAHIRIVAMYIVGPARRHRSAEPVDYGDDRGEDEAYAATLKGTGGSELVRFLKGIRDQTECAIMSPPPGKQSSLLDPQPILASDSGIIKSIS